MRSLLKLFLCAGVTVLAFYAGYVLAQQSPAGDCTVPATCVQGGCPGHSGSDGCVFIQGGTGTVCAGGLAIPPGSNPNPSPTCWSKVANGQINCTGTNNGVICQGYLLVCSGSCPQ